MKLLITSLHLRLDASSVSKKNLECMKAKEIKDVCVAKKPGISVERM